MHGWLLRPAAGRTGHRIANRAIKANPRTNNAKKGLLFGAIVPPGWPGLIVLLALSARSNLVDRAWRGGTCGAQKFSWRLSSAAGSKSASRVSLSSSVAPLHRKKKAQRTIVIIASACWGSRRACQLVGVRCTYHRHRAWDWSSHRGPLAKGTQTKRGLRTRDRPVSQGASVSSPSSSAACPKRSRNKGMDNRNKGMDNRNKGMDNRNTTMDNRNKGYG
jgi:hypothetical protein